MKIPIDLLYIFLGLLGLFVFAVILIIFGLKKPLKKASIEFVEKKKEITTIIHFKNVNNEQEKEILRDINFDLMQMEIKLKKYFSPSANIKNWKIPFEYDKKKCKEKV